MALAKHDLLHEFPNNKESIHHLKTTNNHFAKLFEQYHELDHEVHRIETGAETPTDEYLDEVKKKRLKLKDSLYAMIQTYESDPS